LLFLQVFKLISVLSVTAGVTEWILFVIILHYNCAFCISLEEIITINVPLFKKLRDIIFFWWENHFMSHFKGHFEGAKTFLTP
jgi:hypothetical protein